MSEVPEVSEHHEGNMPAGAIFTDRLNYLFDTRRSPSGRSFTNTEVSAASDGVLSGKYLSQLRKGLVKMPGVDKLHALARVFGVEVSFFFANSDVSAHSPTPAEDLSEDALVREALKDPVMRDVLLESREYSAEEWAVLMDMVRYARAVIARGRVRQQE